MSEIKLGSQVEDNNGNIGYVFRLESYLDEPSKISQVYFINKEHLLMQCSAENVKVKE